MARRLGDQTFNGKVGENLRLRYIVSDQCFWQQLSKAESTTYNPYDKTRAPHCIQLIDAETGTIVNLISGSVIEVVQAREA